MNAYDVVTVKNAFSCIGDKNNSNWNAFSPRFNKATIRACLYAHRMMSGDINKFNLPEAADKIVYYHDNSISCPKSWSNKYYKPVLMIKTKNFSFYKIVPIKRNR